MSENKKYRVDTKNEFGKWIIGSELFSDIKRAREMAHHLRVKGYHYVTGVIESVRVVAA